MPRSRQEKSRRENVTPLSSTNDASSTTARVPTSSVTPANAREGEKARLRASTLVESSRRLAHKSFPFMSLPTELRLRIYGMALGVSKGRVVDLDPQNYRNIHSPLLSLFLVSHQLHEETFELFYGTQTIQLFPQHGRFFHTNLPLLARLPPRYRKAVTATQLRLGPGWSSPPRSQRITPSLGLDDCVSLRRLRLFVECDPSDAIFTGFRGKGATENTYKDFCITLLRNIFALVKSLEIVEVDAYPSVRKEGMLLTALRQIIEEHDKRLVWGKGIRERELERRGGSVRMEELTGAFGGLALEDMGMASVATDVVSHIVEIRA